jgi:hypothetical protein
MTKASKAAIATRDATISSVAVRGQSKAAIYESLRSELGN